MGLVQAAQEKWTRLRSSGDYVVDYPGLTDELKGANGDYGKRAKETEATINESPSEEALQGWVMRRIARAAARPLKRLARLRLKIAGRGYEFTGPQSAAGAVALAVGTGGLDLLMSYTIVYLVAYLAVIFTLEATGMLTSLTAWDSTLQHFRIPMSLASGGIIVLAGHGAGDLFHQALRKGARFLAGAAVAILIVVALGLVTINQLGQGREKNLRSQAQLQQVDQLRGQATKLNGRALDLERPLPAARGARKVPARNRQAAAALRNQARALEGRADKLQTRAFNGRSLKFFAAVQMLGLAVGAIGGFLYGETGTRRNARIVARLMGRAAKQFTKVLIIAHDEVGSTKFVHGLPVKRAYTTAREALEPFPKVGIEPEDFVERLTGIRPDGDPSTTDATEADPSHDETNTTTTKTSGPTNPKKSAGPTKASRQKREPRKSAQGKGKTAVRNGDDPEKVGDIS